MTGRALGQLDDLAAHHIVLDRLTALRAFILGLKLFVVDLAEGVKMLV